jgi:glycerol-3-phosphate acyltransferase PlsY
MVSLSSLTATVVVVVLSIVFGEFVYADILPQAILVISMGAIVFLKHTSNIKRLISGTESKIGKGKKK